MINPTEQQIRLLGARDGLIHALIAVSNARALITGPGGTYLPPSRHVRKRVAVNARLAELDNVRVALHARLDSIKAAIADTM